MEIRSNSFQGNQLPPQTATKSVAKRSHSAPAKLGITNSSGTGKLGDHIFRTVDSPPQTRAHQNSPRSPSLTIEDELTAARETYRTALAKEKEETDAKPILTTLFGAKSTAAVLEAKRKLIRLQQEKELLDQVTLASKESFRDWVRAQGGNPAIAEEVFTIAFQIPDCSTPPDTVAAPADSQVSAGLATATTTSSDLANHDEEDEKLQLAIESRKEPLSETSPDKFDREASATWRDVNPALETAQQAKKEIKTPLTVENFKDRLKFLNKKEIIAFLNSLSSQNKIKLVETYFDPSLYEIILTMSANEVQQFLLNTFIEESEKIQKETPLIEKAHIYDIIQNAFLDEPAPIEHQGLSNGGVDCYLSSALQCLRQHLSNFSEETRDTLRDSLVRKYTEYLHTLPSEKDNLATLNSPLVAFLEGRFDGRDPNAASFLRLEVQRVLTELTQSGRNSSQAPSEIAQGINASTGNSMHQCDASEALIALMEYVGTPAIEVKEIDTYRDGDPKAGQIREGRLINNEGNFLLPFGVEERPTSIGNVISTNWSTDQDNIEETNDKNSKHNIHRKRLLLHPPESFTISLNRFRMKPDPTEGWAKNSRGEDIVGVPKLALDRYGYTIPEKLHTPIAGLVDTIKIPTAPETGEPDHVHYTPTSIVCHYGGTSANSGHYATYQKKGDHWFLINDALVMPINLDQTMAEQSNLTHRQFLEQNAYIVNYKKI